MANNNSSKFGAGMYGYQREVSSGIDGLQAATNQFEKTVTGAGNTFGEKVKKAGGDFEAATKVASESLKEAGSKLKGDLIDSVDKVVNNYISQQTALTTHLMGASKNLGGIVDNLQSSLSTTGIVSLEKVYNNLTKLINSGVLYNVEQRAFIQTIAEDMDIMFKANDATLRRLVRIQNEDSTANRLAMTYSLQQFLNKTYENSEYIADAMQSVSNSLLELSALTTSSSSLGIESTIQRWLGSYYSAGVSGSTVQSLASALNALGSGDISNLGSGINNLLLMGSARAGLDYGNLLNVGVSTSDVDAIMKGVSSYIVEMGGSSSNVVKSQLAKIFGISVADIAAMANMITTGGMVATDFASVFSDYKNSVALTTRMTNTFQNMLTSTGLGIATDPASYMGYLVAGVIEKSGIGHLVEGLGDGIPFVDAMANAAGWAMNNARLVEVLGASIFNGTLGNIATSMNDMGSISNIMSELGGGSGIVKSSAAGKSASTYIGSGDISDILEHTKTSGTDLATTLNIEGVEEQEDHLLNIDTNVSLIYEYLDIDLRQILNDIRSEISSSYDGYHSHSSAVVF